MTQGPATSATSAPACAACGATLSGRFCSHCGAAAETGACLACKTQLSPGARYCHRCGVPAGPAAATARRERTAWVIAGTAVLLALLVVVWRAGGARPTVPDMGNAGNIGAGGTLPLGRAPDISALSPRQRFDRLYERVVRAAEAGDTITVVQFAPMALGAYALLDTVNADARYHAAMIQLAVGDAAAALALADTIEANAPEHLFADIVRGEVADRRNDTTGLTRAYRNFLDHYSREMRAGRIEYQEHRPILDDFSTRAKASLGR
jgi:hypothetical protein